MTHVIIQTTNSSEDGLINAVRYANISFKFCIGCLSKYCKDDSVLCCHIFADCFQLVQVLGALKVNLNLFSK